MMFLFLVTISAILSFNLGIAMFSNATSPTEQFRECCQQIPLMPETIWTECKFPPDNPSYPSIIDLYWPGHWNPYIECYTNQKDNRECCKHSGVVGKYEYCQLLCDGTHTHPAPPIPPMYLCEEIKANISKCNEAAYSK